MNRVGEKRRRIVEAARGLVLRHGLRGTTMEAIARAARIAKPTLYVQFPDKDAVFAAIVDGVMDELMLAFDEGMAGKGTVSERIGDAVAGHFVALARVMEGSPHAPEIMNEHKRSILRSRESDMRAENEIAEALTAAGAGDGTMLARIILAACYGIALKTQEEAGLAAAIRLVCQRLIEPSLPGEGR